MGCYSALNLKESGKMADDRNYYLVPKGGETYKAISTIEGQRESATQSWVAFAKKYGTDRVGHNGIRLIGIGLDEPPEGWLECKNLPGCYRPHSRLKVCRDAYKEFKAIPSLQSGWEFASALNIEVVIDGGHVHYPTYEVIGGDFILSLHPKHTVPADVTPLKKSEYWALKEAA